MRKLLSSLGHRGNADGVPELFNDRRRAATDAVTGR